MCILDHKFDQFQAHVVELESNKSVNKLYKIVQRA